MPSVKRTDLPITTRPGLPADLPEIQRLNRALFQYEHDQGFYHDDSYNLNWPYEAAGTTYFAGCLDDNPQSMVVVAEADGALVGYLAAAYATRSYRSVNPIGELENMFVAETYRRQGVGRRLVQAFLDWAHEHHVARVRVGAFAGNDQATTFYRSCGFHDSELILEQSCK